MAIIDRKVGVQCYKFQTTSQLTVKYNGVQLINIGGTNCNINGGSMVLAPGAQVGWQHNANEVNETVINIAFEGGSGVLQAIVLYYME